MYRNRRRVAAVSVVGFCLPAILIFCTTASAAVFISDGAVGSTGRTLLQASTACPVNFDRMNYTIFTSRCKGPSYPPGPCCEAYREFACPYARELNDATYACADTMNNYILRRGNYPSGTFAACTDSARGIECPALAAGPPGSNSAAGAAAVPVLGATAAWVVLGQLLLSI